jgi:hypothetical protein
MGHTPGDVRAPHPVVSTPRTSPVPLNSVASAMMFARIPRLICAVALMYESASALARNRWEAVLTDRLTNHTPRDVMSHLSVAAGTAHTPSVSPFPGGDRCLIPDLERQSDSLLQSLR